MARPASTYRGARRNAWRDEGCPPWSQYRLAGDNRKQWIHPFDETVIKHRPHNARGWNWRNGGRSVLEKLKQIWRHGQGSAQDRMAAINKMIAEERK